METKIQEFIENREGVFVNTFIEYIGGKRRMYVVFECKNGHINEKRVDTVLGLVKRDQLGV